MRWGDLRRSSNVEDRRGQGGGFGGGFGRGGGGMRRGGIGIGTLIIVGLLAWATGINPAIILGGVEMFQGGGSGQVQQEQIKAGKPDDETGKFIAAILGSTEDTWNKIFQANSATYQEPRLVLFSGMTPSACGMGQAAMGPFYCPGDRKVYLDTSFFRQLSERFKAPGDFAAAYVVAHEVGHHVQNLMGIMDKVMQQRQRLPKAQSNELSVRTELQADCFAGVWAHNARSSLEEGDIEEALRAASAIGDDRIQRQTQGMVVPDSFTHGSSDQRVRWFKTGFQSGNVQDCNTFAATVL